MNVTLPNGHTIENVPEGTSKEEIMQKAVNSGLAKPEDFLAQQEAAPQKEYEPNLYDAPRAALQGVTFGWSDEIGNAIASIPAALMTGENVGKVFNSMQEQSDLDAKNYKENNPKTALGLEIAGGVATGVVGGAKLAATKGAQLLTNPIARNSAVGAAEGAIYGAGSSDTGEKTEGAATGAAIGAVAAPVIASGANAIKNVTANKLQDVTEYISKRIFDNDDKKAERVVRRMMEMEGLTPDEVVNRYNQLGDEGMLVDTGNNFRSLGRAATDRLGEAKAVAGKLFNGRQMGQQKRLLSSLEESVGVESGNYKSITDGIKSQRFEQASPYYNEAFKEGFNPEFSSDMNKLLDTTVMKSALKNANKYAELEGEKIVNPLQQLHYAKMHLDTVIETQMKKSPSYARKLIGFKNRLLDEMDKASPSYKEGRDIWAGDSQLLDAAKQGEKLFSRGVDSDELIDIVKGMSASEKEMFQLGAMRNVKNILDDTDMNANVVKKLLGKQRLRDRLALAFDDPKQIEEFIKKAEAEKQFSITKNSVTGGSQTSGNLEAGKALDSEVNMKWLPETRGDSGTLVIDVAKNLTVGGKPNENVIKRVSDIILNSDLPEEEMRRILTDQGASKLIQAIRNTPRLTDGVVPVIESFR